jgi:hypothetical protein
MNTKQGGRVTAGSDDGFIYQHGFGYIHGLNCRGKRDFIRWKSFVREHYSCAGIWCEKDLGTVEGVADLAIVKKSSGNLQVPAALVPGLQMIIK